MSRFGRWSAALCRDDMAQPPKAGRQPDNRQLLLRKEREVMEDALGIALYARVSSQRQADELTRGREKSKG